MHLGITEVWVTEVTFLLNFKYAKVFQGSYLSSDLHQLLKTFSFIKIWFDSIRKVRISSRIVLIVYIYWNGVCHNRWSTSSLHWRSDAFIGCKMISACASFTNAARPKQEGGCFKYERHNKSDIINKTEF